MGTCASGDVILSSNTSSYDINDLAHLVPNPEKVIGTHWFHPPPITPCVEIIPCNYTNENTIEKTILFFKKLGKIPTLCKSAPGFVANRLQMALAAEAISLVEEGLATPSEIDQIVKTSFGFRLSAYGPFEIMDQAGLDVYLNVFEYLYEKLKKPHFSPPELLTKYVKADRLGLKTSDGFYKYSKKDLNLTKKERDKRLFARLNLFLREK